MSVVSTRTISGLDIRRMLPSSLKIEDDASLSN